MVRILLIAVCAAALAGCVDSYTPIPGGSAKIANVRADARDCREIASNTYLYDQGHGAQALGVLAAGAIGGAAGGAAFGAGLSASKNAPQPSLDQMIEDCMASRGYTGTSSQ